MVFYTVNGIEQEYLLSKDKVRVLALKRQSGMVELSNYTDWNQSLLLLLVQPHWH